MGSSSIGSALLTVGTGGLYQVYQSVVADPLKAQKNAQAQALAQAKATQDQADQANNRANQKSPDISSIVAGNQQAGSAGVSGTMLTGPSGVDPTALQLGKNTLLGS